MDANKGLKNSYTNRIKLYLMKESVFNCLILHNKNCI